MKKNEAQITEAEVTDRDFPENEVKDLVVAQQLTLSNGLEPIAPRWMSADQSQQIISEVDMFFEEIKENPSDIDLQTRIYKLGDDGSKAMMPHCNLYEVKMAKVMKLQKEGDPITGGLLSIKQELDRINPSVLKKQPIGVKVAVFFRKSRLPKADEVADMIYARRETVKSTIDGIKKDLLESADMLIEDLEEIRGIYDGMIEAQRMVERDIYWAQILHSKLLPYAETVEDQLTQQAIEDNLAALTQVVNALQSEEAANMIFFANAQGYAKQNNLQLFNIRRRIPLLERSVLANLGLKAGMARLRDTMRATDALTDAVGDTLADAAAAGRQMGQEITEARGKAIINMDKLESAIGDIEAMYVEQTEANKKVIDLGTKTSKQLTILVSKIRDRVEGGHESMSAEKQK